MRVSSLTLLGVSMALGALAVFATRAYIANNTQFDVAPVEAEVQVAQVLVAKDSIGFGATLSEDNLILTDWYGEDLPEGAFTSLDPFENGAERYSRTVIGRGEPILPAKVTLPGAKPTLSAALEGNLRAVTIAVDDVLGVAGLITPGDHVDVMLTRTSGKRGEETATVDFLLSNVKVLALDQNADTRTTGEDVRTVTLAVEPLMAQKLALASNVGTLSLALRSANEDDNTFAPGTRLTLDELLGGKSSGGFNFKALSGLKDAFTSSGEGPAIAGHEPKVEPVVRNVEVYHGTERSVFKFGD